MNVKACAINMRCRKKCIKYWYKLMMTPFCELDQWYLSLKEEDFSAFVPKLYSCFDFHSYNVAG